MEPESPTKPQPAILDVRTAADWEAWLDDHHETTPEGVWLRLFRKASGMAELDQVGAVEVALCFGWIDSQAKGHDEVSRLQKFTPRRKASVWSRINTERAERLVADGRMRPAGQRAIDAAKADGRWDRAYGPPSTAEIPADFLAALEADPAAKAFFATLNKRNTYAVVHRLQTAATPATRSRRIAALVERFARGERFYD